MNATDAMRKRQKARVLEIPDAPVSASALRSVYFACGKFLEQRGMGGSKFASGYRVRPGKKSLSTVGTRRR
jgi:hypothetical protein